MGTTLHLSNIVAMADPCSVLAAVKNTLERVDASTDQELLDKVFFDIRRLFSGDFPGYRRCNTEYHDYQHTTDVFLAMARLIHGAILEKHQFRAHDITLGLFGALLHDTGYIQTFIPLSIMSI